MEAEEEFVEDQAAVLCQFALLLIQILLQFPQLFGFALSSSSSSGMVSSNVLQTLEEDDDENLFQILVARNLCLRWLVYDVLDNYNDGYQWWVKPKITAWFYEFLMGYYGDDRWIENMRMTRSTFGELCEILGPSIIKQDTNYRRAIPEFAS
ncbi:unnamed protein product [Calypogeia fissa]